MNHLIQSCREFPCPGHLPVLHAVCGPQIEHSPSFSMAIGANLGVGHLQGTLGFQTWQRIPLPAHKLHFWVLVALLCLGPEQLNQGKDAQLPVDPFPRLVCIFTHS
uniref:Macaca fascicularis brain cDNA, clone: QtrA-16590 n=1 Tax=Macaca fascicularis TaxID=9541 RepID=I7G9G9_MACFA|nr:unnamed protein product [Macaca fascicularis]